MVINGKQENKLSSSSSIRSSLRVVPRDLALDVRSGSKGDFGGVTDTYSDKWFYRHPSMCSTLDSGGCGRRCTLPLPLSMVT